MRPGRIRPGEGEGHAVIERERGVASMRPGRIRPGEGEGHAVIERERGVASMRPGRIRPGESRRSPAACNPVQRLQ